MSNTEKPVEERYFTFSSDNQEIIQECVRDMVNFGWELKGIRDENGVTTITFYVRN